jgi:cyclophilin family peptidyl-prolyl cis-trans isomerase/HEAT repeat protein
MLRRGALAALLLLPAAGVERAAAQADIAAETIARVLAAEDARRYDSTAFGRAAASPVALARRSAALAIGRVGNGRGLPLLLTLLDDRDSTVQAEAAFALGLLRDSAAVEPLTERLNGTPALDAATAREAVTALAKIGGARAGEYFAALLQDRAPLTADRGNVLDQAVLEAWRLRAHAPVAVLLPFARDTSLLRRQRAHYSLGRLRPAAAFDRLLEGLRDGDVTIRANAARVMTRSYADSAGRAPATVADLLLPLVDDPDPGVRINAMRSLGSFRLARLAPRVVPHADDPFPNARVQAVMTLGELGGPEAAAALRRALESRVFFAARREALVGLARVDSAAFLAEWDAWRTSADWRERAAAAEGWARLQGGPPAGEPFFLGDPDGRVTAAGLQAWSEAATGPDARLLAAARPRLAAADAAVRSIAADIVGRAADPKDAAALVAAYGRAARDSFPEAAISALAALSAIEEKGGQAASQAPQAPRAAPVARFVATAPRPASPTVLAWAADNWPALARRWGRATPVATGRSAQDYRELVRRFVLPDDSTANPRVIIETDQRGRVTVELFGRDAPLTVANFLRLVDQHFFDGNRWHRVVPNFVVQDGDPRGDGWGGPGGAIRDEINRRRYDKPVLGMALSGPDTGSSQWFINLSPQPHLDGTYTVFGQVVDGFGSLARITQGDLIRTIRR